VTGPLIRLSSGLRYSSDVMTEPLTVVVEPSPVLRAGTGNTYGSLGVAWPVSTSVPWPVVTEAEPRRVQTPTLFATALLLPFTSNGNEFTRYPLLLPVPIAGSSPVTGMPDRETGPATESWTAAASCTSCDLEMARTMAPR